MLTDYISIDPLSQVVRGHAAPGTGEEYCDEHICLCVSVFVSVCQQAHLRNYTSFTTFLCMSPMS